MKFLKDFRFWLFVIVVFAAVLRFYNLGKVPVSLYWDEVATSYNAFSILQTGKDEYGVSHPFLFKSFNDYKSPANIYLTSLAIPLFGLNEFSTRFTSAFFGTLSVLVSFFLFSQLLKLNPKRFNLDPPLLPLLTTFLFAISPWHLQFSRGAFEANVGLFFLIGAIKIHRRTIPLSFPRFLKIK